MVSRPGPAARIVLMRGLGLTQVGFFPGPFGLGGDLNPACFSFSGSNHASIAALSTNLIGGGGSFTVSWKAKCVPYGGLFRVPLALIGDSGNYVSLFSPRDSSQKIRVFSNFNGTTKMADTSVNAPVTWSVFCEQYDHGGGLYRIFLNGESIFTTSVPAFRSSVSTTIFLGSYNATQHKFLGQLADIRLYSAVVTPNHSIPMTQEANGVAWYITPKADGSIVDSLGNGNTLTTTGGTLYGASGGPGLPWWPA